MALYKYSNYYLGEQPGSSQHQWLKNTTAISTTNTKLDQQQSVITKVLKSFYCPPIYKSPLMFLFSMRKIIQIKG